jgi:tetratricopeptide (TPR) repeat protein
MRPSNMRRVVLPLAYAVFATSAFANFDPVKFVMKNGDKVYGIMVAETQGTFVVTSPKGARTLAKRDVAVPGSWNPQAREASRIVDRINSNVASLNFSRIEEYLVELTGATGNFEEAAAPFINQPLATAFNRQDCLRQAVLYFRQKHDAVPPVMDMLKLVVKVQGIIGEVKTQKRRLRNDLLVELISLHDDLLKEVAVPRSRRLEKDAAINRYRELIKTCTSKMREVAVELYVGKDREQINQLLTTLQTAKQKETAEFAVVFEPLVTEVAAVVKKQYREPLPAITEKLFTFDEEWTEFQRTFNAAVQELAKENAYMNSLLPFVYGENTDAIGALVKAEVAANQAAVQGALARRQLIKQIRAAVRAASVALTKREYAVARKSLQALSKEIAEQKLPKGDITRQIVKELFEANARDILDRLRRSQELPLEELPVLLAEGQAFLKEHSTNLGKLKLKKVSYENGLESLKGILQYRQRIATLNANLAASRVVAWQSLKGMQAWMQGEGDTVVPSELSKTWPPFFAEASAKLSTEMEAYFLTGPTGLDGAAVAVLGELIEQLFNAEEQDRALALVDKNMASADRKMRRTLLVRRVRVAESYVEGGELEKAKEIYDNIAEKHPDFVREFDLQGQLLKLRVRKVDLLINSGQATQAVALLNEIIVDNKQFAVERGLYKKAIELRVKMLKSEEQSADDLLMALNSVCADYPGQMKEVPEVIRAVDGERSRFEVMWQKHKFVDAMAHYANFLKTFPNLSKEVRYAQTTAAYIWRDVQRELDKANLANKPVPIVVVRGVGDLIRKYPKTARESRIDHLYVSLNLNHASHYEASEEIPKAYERYSEMARQFPEIAADRNLDATLQRLQLRYTFAEYLEPVGISYDSYLYLDWIAAILTIIIWPIFVIRTWWFGRKRGHARYRFAQLSISFAIFLLLMGLFIFGSFPFALAFFIAFVVPEAVFQGMSLKTYRYFPLVYCERIISVERTFVQFLKLPILVTVFQNMRERVANDLFRREEDLPLLHDRVLYNIHQAVIISRSQPDRGDELLLQIQGQLEAEVFAKDERWREHYHTCVFERAQLAMQRGNVEDAIELFEADLEFDPKNPNSLTEHRVLGELHFQAANYSRAASHIRVCLRIQGSSDKLWYQLGRSYFEVEDFAAACKCFGKIEGPDRDGLFYGARSYFHANQRTVALEWYQQLLKAHPNDGEAVYYMASSFAQQGEDRKALKLVALLKKSDTYFNRGQALIANLLLRAGKYDEAQQVFHKVLAADQNCVPALIGLGQVAGQMGNVKDAVSYYEHVLREYPSHATVNYLVGALIEKSDGDKALHHFGIAARSPSYRRLVANRTGRIQFFKGDYEEAVAQFKVAEQEGEQSPWFLYLYSYSLAIIKDIDACESVLLRILGRNYPEPSWQKYSLNAMYSIGTVFLEQGAFKLALRCFEFVKTYQRKRREALDAIIEETRFRLVIMLIAEEDYEGAESTVNALLDGCISASRAVLYRYYLCLCHLYEGRFSEASNELRGMLDGDNSNVRFLYHLAIAELGLGDIRGCLNIVGDLKKDDSLPGHIAVGLYTLQAHLMAVRGDIDAAEEAIGNIPELQEDYPGIDDVRHRVQLARVFYRCMKRDPRGITEAVDAMDACNRASGVYLHAIAIIQAGELEVAMKLLSPHIGGRGKVDRLYTSLAVHAATSAVVKEDFSSAHDSLTNLPHPEPEAEAIRVALHATNVLRDLGSDQGFQTAIQYFVDHLKDDEQDPNFSHAMNRNLLLLRLGYAIFLEEEGTREEATNTAWSEWSELWQKRIGEASEFWNREQLRIEDSQGAKFSAEEIAEFNKRYALEGLGPILYHFAIANLDTGDDQAINRVMSLVEIVGDKTGQTNAMAARLAQRLSEYRGALDEEDPKQNVWGFQIASLTIRHRIDSMLGQRNKRDLEADLDIQRQCRARYRTPKEYRDAKSQFLFDLLDALQTGAMGNFVDAGEKLTKALRDIPPGTSMGKNIDKMRVLVEAARNPKKYEANGMNLNTEFDKLYTTVKRLHTT